MQMRIPLLNKPMDLLNCISLSALLIGAQARAELIQVCPDEIQLESAQLKSDRLSSGWASSSYSGPVRLTGVSLFDGPPQEGAQLKPANAETSDSNTVWHFSPIASNLWLRCDYASGLFSLSMKVQEPVAECRAVLMKTGLPKVLHAKFSCR